MNKPKPSEVFEVRRHDITPERAAELADAAGYAYIAVKGQVYQVTRGRETHPPTPGFEAQVSYRGPICSVDVLDSDEPLGHRVEARASIPVRFALKPEGPAITVLDGLYDEPMLAREAALASDLAEHPERHKGLRSSDFPIPEMFRELFATVVGPVGGGHSAFQLNLAGEQLVYHSDQQRWAAAVYLTPFAPPEAGTSFWRSRTTRVRSSDDLHRLAGKDGWPDAGELERITYGGKLLDRTAWEEVDRVGNLFNRLAIWDARLIHSVTDCFGHDVETGRLCQLFFWNPA